MNSLLGLTNGRSPSPGEYAAIRAFVAVARAMSFAGAARALGLSPSALSQAVRGLENRLGQPLLHRTTRSMALTDAGRQFFDRMEPLVAAMAEGFDLASAAGPDLRGTLRIHAARLAARLYVAPALSRLATRHPGLIVDLTLDDAVIDPVSNGYDAAIRLGEVIGRDMVSRSLGPSLKQCVVASPVYRDTNGLPSTPVDLLDHRCILWRWPGQQLPHGWEFEENGRWFTMRPPGALVVNDREFATLCAVNGDGIAMVAEPHVSGHLNAGRLVSMLDRWCGPYPGFHLCYPQRRTATRELRAFIEALFS